MYKLYSHRILSFFLALSLVVSLTVCPVFAEVSAAAPHFSLSAEDEAVVGRIYCAPERTPIDYAEMEPNLFDEAYTDSVLAQMRELCATSGNLARLQALFDEVVDQYERLMTDYSLLGIAYDADCTNDEIADTYNTMDVKLADISDRMCLTLQEVLLSPYGDAMAVYMDDLELADDLREYNALDDEAYRLLQESSDLQLAYNRLMNDPDSNDPHTEEAFYELYLQVLDNMIAIAAYDGYDSYAEEAYESYGRDYTPEDLSALRRFAKNFAAPYLSDFDDAFYASKGYRSYRKNYSEAEIFEMLRPWLKGVSVNAGKAFDELETYHLHDMGYSPTKNDRGYTVDLPYYGTRFIFDYPYRRASDAMTLAHEFGHFYAGYMDKTPSFYKTVDLDLAEVHSQGMEMLLMPYLREIFGDTLGEAMEFDCISGMLYSVVEGCLQDELQLRALQARMNGTLNTTEDLAALVYDVYADYYGEYYVASSGNWRNWCTVPHTFTAPFYYISYAVSATAALGIFSLETEDYLYARQLYIALTEGGESVPFAEAIGSSGLPSPLTVDGCRQIERNLATCFSRLLHRSNDVLRLPSVAA